MHQVDATHIPPGALGTHAAPAPLSDIPVPDIPAGPTRPELAALYGHLAGRLGDCTLQLHPDRITITRPGVSPVGIWHRDGRYRSTAGSDLGWQTAYAAANIAFAFAPPTLPGPPALISSEQVEPAAAV